MKKCVEFASGVIILALAVFCLVNNASAIDFSGSTTVGFRLNEAMSLSINGDIEINGLAPGMQKDSDGIEISVMTNASRGYTLSATVGDSEHNTSDLGLDASNKFTSIATSANLGALSADNTWGYRLSNDNSTWGNYNGLSLYSNASTVLAEDSSMPVGGMKTLYFRIGAKAASSLSVGDYSNNITFYVLARFSSDLPVMQEINTWESTLDVGDSIQAVDSRDYKVYWVTRLSDGKIWMTQNLDLDLGMITLDNTNTDLNTISSFNPNLTYATTGLWGWDYDEAESYDPGNYYLANGTADTGTSTTCNLFASDDVNCHYHQGNYYNWYAATAGSNAEIMATGDEAENSICPKGWRLPYGTQNVNSWYFLVQSSGMTFSNSSTSPFYITRAGVFDGSEVYYAGTNGLYWSSTAYDGFGAYSLLVSSTSSSIDSQMTNDAAMTGFSVRCVARGRNMQDVDEWGDSLAIGDSVQAVDLRDNKTYWVTRLCTGGTVTGTSPNYDYSGCTSSKIWMTQNLDLDLSSSVTLTPSDTNITSNWTPASTATTVVKTDLNSSNWDTSSHDDEDIPSSYWFPYSFDGGDVYFPDGVLSSSCSNKDITTCPGAGTLSLTDTSAVLNNINAHYHVGNHYSLAAAIAFNDSSEYTTRLKNVSSSICPKGWRLPSSYEGSWSIAGDFTNLNNAYGDVFDSDSVLLAAPLYFVRAGDVWGGSPSNFGLSGSYWSSTANCILYFAVDFGVDTLVTVSDDNIGNSIRCIAE